MFPAEEALTPMIVRYGKWGSDQPFFLVAEREVYMKVHSFAKALIVIVLIGLYFIFNTKYPQPYSNTHHFIQRVLLEIKSSAKFSKSLLGNPQWYRKLIVTLICFINMHSCFYLVILFLIPYFLTFAPFNWFLILFTYICFQCTKRIATTNIQWHHYKYAVIAATICILLLHMFWRCYLNTIIVSFLVPVDYTLFGVKRAHHFAAQSRWVVDVGGKIISNC